MTKKTNGTLNRVLQRLDVSEFRRFETSLHAVELSFKEQLYDQGKPIPYMFFVESGVVSLATDLGEGGTCSRKCSACATRASIPPGSRFRKQGSFDTAEGRFASSNECSRTALRD